MIFIQLDNSFYNNHNLVRIKQTTSSYGFDRLSLLKISLLHTRLSQQKLHFLFFQLIVRALEQLHIHPL